MQKVMGLEDGWNAWGPHKIRTATGTSIYVLYHIIYYYIVLYFIISILFRERIRLLSFGINFCFMEVEIFELSIMLNNIIC